VPEKQMNVDNQIYLFASTKSISPRRFLLTPSSCGRETKTASVSARFFSCDTHGLAIGLLSDMGAKTLLFGSNLC